MKLLIVLSLVALAVAAPPPPRSVDNREVELLRYENDSDDDGYSFQFEQSDGQSHSQRGELRNAGREDEYVAVKGSFSWIAPNGIRYTVTYVADENGYQPEVEEGPGGASPAVLASLLG